MAEEFEKILEFFSLDEKDKQDHLKDVFDDTVAYFEKFKYVLENGTPEEKKEMMAQIATMQKEIKQETEKLSDETGLSEEQLNDVAQDPSNFSEEQWEIITEARGNIEHQASEINKVVSYQKGESPKTPKKKTGPKKRKNWMPS